MGTPSICSALYKGSNTKINDPIARVSIEKTNTFLRHKKKTPTVKSKLKPIQCKTSVAKKEGFNFPESKFRKLIRIKYPIAIKEIPREIPFFIRKFSNPFSFALSKR